MIAILQLLRCWVFEWEWHKRLAGAWQTKSWYWLLDLFYQKGCFISKRTVANFRRSANRKTAILGLIRYRKFANYFSVQVHKSQIRTLLQSSSSEIANPHIISMCQSTNRKSAKKDIYPQIAQEDWRNLCADLSPLPISRQCLNKKNWYCRFVINSNEWTDYTAW